MARLIETATAPSQQVDVDPVTLDLDRERAAQRPLRDGRGAVPHRAVAGHPRAARRVPADRRPRREDGRRPVRPVHPRLPRRLRRRRSRRATSCSPPTRTPAAPRSATPTTGWSSCRSSSTAASSAGRRCSATCPTSAARRRRRCRPTRSTIFEEGVVIPPFKLYTKGVLNEDALRIILNQVRKPDWNRADLNGIVAACRTAAPPGAGDVRPLRRRHLPLGAGRAARPQLPAP